MFAVPLFLFPVAFLRALGWTVVDPMAARGVATTLVGIGTQSLLSQLDRPGLPRAAVAQDSLVVHHPARLRLDGARRRTTSRMGVRGDLRALQRPVDVLASSSQTGDRTRYLRLSFLDRGVEHRELAQ